MLTSKPITKEGWIIQHGATSIRNRGYETLRLFSIQKLLEEKMVTRNFKTGLTFDSVTSARTSIKSLARFLNASFVKRNPAVKTNADPVAAQANRNRGYNGVSVMAGVRRSYQWKEGELGPFNNSSVLMFETVDEPVVQAYLERLNTLAERKNYPIRVVRHTQALVYQDRDSVAGNDQVAVRRIIVWKVQVQDYRHRVATENGYLNLYRVLFHLGDIHKIMRTLYRKSVFADRELLVMNQSKVFPKQLGSMISGRQPAHYYGMDYRIGQMLTKESFTGLPKITEMDLLEGNWHLLSNLKLREAGTKKNPTHVDVWARVNPSTRVIEVKRA